MARGIAGRQARAQERKKHRGTNVRTTSHQLQQPYSTETAATMLIGFVTVVAVLAWSLSK